MTARGSRPRAPSPVPAGSGTGNRPGRGGLRVFGNVLQGLQDAEVSGGLGVAGVAPDAVGLDQDWQRGLAGLRSQGWPEPLVGQQRGVDPAGQGPQVIERGVQPAAELAGDLPDFAGVFGGVFQQGELDGERDELLLGAVMKVPFDPLPLLILCPHQPPPRRLQIVDRGLQLGGEADVAKDQARL